MSLEVQVAALVTETTNLSAAVNAELNKVRTENANFKTTVVSKAGDTLSGPLTLPSFTTTGNVTINNITVGRGSSNNESNTVLGLRAGSNPGAIQSGLTAIGVDALKSNTNGNWNTAVGRLTLSNNTEGGHGTAVGNAALATNSTGVHNTGIGFHALVLNTTGGYNTALGSNSLPNNTTGIANAAIGGLSLVNNNTGSWNTAIGQDAGAGNTTGNNNTAVGGGALRSSAGDYTNTSGFGFNAQVSGNNQVQLGDSSTTTFCYGAVQNRSDARDKTDIRPTVLGLDFIKALKPRDFRWDMREAYRTPAPTPPPFEASDEEKSAYQVSFRDWQNRNKFANLTHDGSKKKRRIHHGLIAQEVAELIRTTGVDFGGYQDHKISGGDDVLSIGYNELIAPLIKGMQELAQLNEDLRARVATLEAKAV